MDKVMKEITDPKTEFFAPVVTGANFTIYIGGLVAVHRTTRRSDPNFWQIAFLDEIPDHGLKAILFTYENGSIVGEPIDFIANGSGHTFEFEMESESSTALPADHISTADTGIGKIGDFSGTELHGTTAGPAPVRLTRRTKAISKLSIKSGTGYTARLSTGGDMVPDLYCFSKAGNVVRELGHWFAIDNEGTNGTQLMIKIDGNEWVPPSGPLKFKTGREYKLVIDNMCWATHCASNMDFPHYYNRSHEGKNYEGIIDEDVVELKLVKSKNDLPVSGDIKMLNFRVACNAMLISQIEGGQDLFAALGL